MSTAPYTYGVILPTAGEDDEKATKPLRLLPPEVRRVTAGLALSDYTQEGVEEAMGRYWSCVDSLVSQGAQSVVLAGVPISSQLGRARVLELLAETTRRTGVPADGAAEAIIAAFQRLGVRRVAIGSRWAEQLNQAMARYLTEAGIEVLYVTSVGQWGRQAFAMSIEEGVQLALQLGVEALRSAPQAEALLLPGGSWRPMGVVQHLEESLGKPVITNENSRLWRVIHGGHAPSVTGWGRLLAAG
jgi:maleate cis-trans isomerase